MYILYVNYGDVEKEFNITTAGSVEIDIEIKLLIAIGVATILHGRKEWEPPFRDGVVVYPGETFDADFRFNRGEIAGMAGEGRPLLITKNILKKSFENSSDGYNSLLHEIAHYFDFENRGFSGVPLIGNSAENSLKWKNAIESERSKISKGSSFLRSYGDVNDSEFFAVATEFFFERPEEMFNKKGINTPEQFASMELEDIEKLVKSTGFYKNKAKNIKKTSEILLEKYDGEVPKEVDRLTELAGVGRKTANVVRGEIWSVAEGVTVDTHVKRLMNLIGIVG